MHLFEDKKNKSSYPSLTDKAGYFINVTIRPRLPKPDPGKRRLACVGDSLTYGAGVRLRRGRDSYPAQLGELLGEDWQVLNYGLSWRTLQNSGDLPYQEEDFYPASLRCGAEVYLLMLGSNDAKPFNWNGRNYRRDLREFVKTYLSLPQSPMVILMQPTISWIDRHGKAPYGIRPEVLGGELHTIVGEVGAELGCRVLDLFRLSKAHPDWFHDLAHPNREGNGMIAHYIFSALIETGILSGRT